MTFKPQSYRKKIVACTLAAIVFFQPFLSSRLVAETSENIALVEVYAPQAKAAQIMAMVSSLNEQIKIKSRHKVVLDKAWSKDLDNASKLELKDLTEVREAKKFLETGEKAYFSLNLSDARKFLERARKLFIKNLHRLGDNAPLLRSHLLLGATYVALEMKEKGISEFEKVAFLDPDLEITRKEYSPAVVEAFLQAKQQIDKDVRANLLLETVPEGATIFVNGKEFGVTPNNLSLPAGQYFLRFTKPGFSDWYKLMTFAEGFSRITQDLAKDTLGVESNTPLRPLLSDSRPSPGVVKALDAVLLEMKANILLLCEIQVDKQWVFYCQLYDSRTKEFSPLEFIEGDKPSLIVKSMPTLAQRLIDHIGDNGYVVPDSRFSADPGIGDPTRKGRKPPVIIGQMPGMENANGANLKKRETPIYKTWWFWTIAGVVAGGAGALFLFGGSNDSGKILVDNSGNFAN